MTFGVGVNTLYRVTISPYFETGAYEVNVRFFHFRVTSRNLFI